MGDLIRALLKGGASVGQKNKLMESALLVATRAKHAEAASVLLQNGAWAVEERHIDVLELASEGGVSCVLEGAGVHTDNKEQIMNQFRSFRCIGQKRQLGFLEDRLSDTRACPSPPLANN